MDRPTLPADGLPSPGIDAHAVSVSSDVLYIAATVRR